MTPVTDTYRERLHGLSSATAAAIAPLVDAYQRGGLEDTEFAAAVATVIAAGNAKAAALADLTLAHLLGKPPAGTVAPAADLARLREAVGTITAEFVPNEPGLLSRLTVRIDRLGASAPLEAAQLSWQTGLRVRRIPGWTRLAAAGACRLCTSLADGTILSPSTPMVTHPGCTCTAMPVTREVSIRDDRSTRNIRRPDRNRDT